MNVTIFSRGLCLVALGALVASCSQSPTSASGGATVGTPSQIAPANGATIANGTQPVTLTVTNAFVSDSSANVLYTFEVSTDSQFGTKLQTKTANAGANGQTSVTLDPLAPAQTYFWHVRATGGNTPGPFSPAIQFTIGPNATLGAPTAIAPLSGATPSGWPVFTIGNSSKSGQVGAVTYTFEVNTNSTFTGTTVLKQTQVGENASGQTTFLPPFTTPVTTGTLFWRATAFDSASGASSPPSPVQSIVVSALTRQSQLALQQGLNLWPGVQPPGTNGHATLGDNWVLQTVVSFDGHVFTSPPILTLQEFDLIDRGMDPGDAINWMNSHGYFNDALWVPAVQAVGFQFEYMALVAGAWDLVIRSGA